MRTRKNVYYFDNFEAARAFAQRNNWKGDAMTYSYETRRDMIVTHAWETWTKNGLGLDIEMRQQTERTVQDAASNSYVDGISDQDWLTATLRRLKVSP